MTTPERGAVAALSSTPHSSAGHSALVVVVFFGVLVASCLLLGRCLPFPDVPVVHEKIEQLAHYGDDFDILFVGSSRVHFQVVPAVFDRIAREEGLRVRSFNAGIGAMRPPEDGYFLDQILRGPHQRLRWVFLEIMPINDKRDPILAGTGRYTYWHDWERTGLLTKSFLAECAKVCHPPDRPAMGWSEEMQACGEAVGIWLDNLGLFVENCSNLGRGEALVRRAMAPPRKSKIHAPKNGEVWDGWDSPRIAKPMADNPKRLGDYQRAYDGLLASEQRFDAGDPASLEALRAKIARLNQAKVTPIMIIPPTVAPKRYFPFPLAGQSLAILDFSDPRKFPEFFTTDHRLDGMHLNDAGANLFTEAIARAFVEIVKKSGPVP